MTHADSYGASVIFSVTRAHFTILWPAWVWFLIHIILAYLLWDIDKPCSPRSGATERGVRPRFPLFAYRVFYYNLKNDEKYHQQTWKHKLAGPIDRSGNSIRLKWVNVKKGAHGPEMPQSNRGTKRKNTKQNGDTTARTQLTHLSRIDLPTIISRASLSPILGMLSGIFHFH